MAVNKVVLGEDTLIDLTADTVSADKLSKGITAHNMAGEPIVGTMEAGGGTNYTFTDGLTETDGVVSLDFYKEGYKGKNATIEVDGIGSMAFGYLEYGGKISADVKGSMAFGVTEYGGSIYAISTGSFACGYVDSG